MTPIAILTILALAAYGVFVSVMFYRRTDELDKLAAHFNQQQKDNENLYRVAVKLENQADTLRAQLKSADTELSRLRRQVRQRDSKGRFVARKNNEGAD